MTRSPSAPSPQLRCFNLTVPHRTLAHSSCLCMSIGQEYILKAYPIPSNPASSGTICPPETLSPICDIKPTLISISTLPFTCPPLPNLRKVYEPLPPIPPTSREAKKGRSLQKSQIPVTYEKSKRPSPAAPPQLKTRVCNLGGEGRSLRERMRAFSLSWLQM